MFKFQKKNILERIYCSTCGAKLESKIGLQKFDPYVGFAQKIDVWYGCPNRNYFDFSHGNCWTWTENAADFDTNKNNFDLFIEIRDHYLRS